MADFGNHETANNGILAFLKHELEVGNASVIELDGNLGNQFQIGLKEVRGDRGKMRLLTEKFRDASRILGRKPSDYRLRSPLWGSTYDKYVEHLNRQAAAEKRQREAGGD